MLSDSIVPWSSPCGSNCSYTFSFLGPAYQCENLGPLSSTGINLTEIELSGAVDQVSISPPSDASLLYLGVADAGNETRPIGLVVVLNQTIRCDLYNATCTAAVSYSGNVQSVHKNIEFHNSITDGAAMWGTIGSTLRPNLGSIDFWGPLNMYILQSAAVNSLMGWIAVQGASFQSTTPITYNWPAVVQFQPGGETASGLSNPQLITFVDLASNIEDLLANFTLSFVTISQSSSDISSLRASDNVTSTLIIEITTEATSTSSPLVYIYTPVTLWQVYGVALFFTAICAIVGGFMMQSNGVAGDLTRESLLQLGTQHLTI
jgi:hypothetical protein